MSKTILLYHGAPNIVGRPRHGMGSPHRDFGSGFYCTQNLSMAEEWASPDGTGGYVNEYELDTRGLRILDLRKTGTPVMSWLGLLAANRTFRTDSESSVRAIGFLADSYLPDVGGYDAIRGFRGDDSYFSFATDFINSAVSLGRLASSLDRSRDGEQFVLISEKALSRLRYLASSPVDAEACFRRRCERDLRARSAYLGRGVRESIDEYDIMMEDLVLGRVKRDDPRIQ